MRRFLVLSSVLSLSACSTGIAVSKYDPAPASRQSYNLCHGYSCTIASPTGFTSAEWGKVRDIFIKRPARTAAGERGRIGEAIALMETVAGRKTGTDVDRGEAVSLKSDLFQMDCIDETINTTRYLHMLYDDGLLHFHAPAEPTHRGYFIDGRWPHNTAVMRETASGDLYVVDSFYKPNGEVPYIMPREDWLAGWKPAGSRQ